MQNQIRALIVIPIALGLALTGVAGCADDGGPTSGEEPGAGPIVLRHWGGYAPSKGTITIGPDGRGRIVNEDFDGKRTAVAFTVPADEIAELHARLDALDLATLEVPDPPDCCDIVYYELSYGGSSVETYSGSEPDELADLIGEIQQLAPDDGGSAPQHAE